MLARDFMSTNISCGKIGQKLRDAAKLMAENRFSALPIIDEDRKLVGIITESNFVGKETEVPHALASVKVLFGELFYFGDMEDIYRRSGDKPVENVMTPMPKTIDPDFTLTEVVNFMVRNHLKRVPVVEDDRPVGMITRKDLIKAFNLVSSQRQSSEDTTQMSVEASSNL